MGRFQRSAARQWDRTRRQAALPSWSTRVGLVVGAVLLAYLAFELFAPSKAVQLTSNPVQVTSPSDSTVTSVTTGPGVVTTGGFMVATSGGGTVHISSSAYQAATGAARAYWTGNWSGVAQAPGFSSPVAGVTYASVAVTKVTTPSTAGEVGGTGSLLLDVTVRAPDNTLHATTVTVISPDNGDHWQVQMVS
jgi:hypothetical protein